MLQLSDNSSLRFATACSVTMGLTYLRRSATRPVNHYTYSVSARTNPVRFCRRRNMRVSSGGPHVFQSCPHERIGEANHERHTSSRCVPHLKQYGICLMPAKLCHAMHVALQMQVMAVAYVGVWRHLSAVPPWLSISPRKICGEATS